MARSSGSWKPGQSGNPKGRPRREHTLTDHLRELLRQPHTVDDGGEIVTKLQRIAGLVVDLAMMGDRWAIGLVVERLEGKAATFADLAVVPKLEELERHVEKMEQRKWTYANE